MARVYYRKIIAGAIYLSDVPARWREEVKNLVLIFIDTEEGREWLIEHPNWRGE